MESKAIRYLIDNQDNVDPRVNLALEEYCLTRLDPRCDYFLLYVNEPSVIVGRNQNILQEIDRLENTIRNQEEVDYVISIATVLKYIHQEFHGGDPGYYRIPESKDTIAQYLLLFSLSGQQTLNRLISDDHSWTAIFGRMHSNISTGQVTEFQRSHGMIQA